MSAAVWERVLAPNPGPMTLDGTNTWLLRAPGAARCVVVDPGPDDPGHHAAVLQAAEQSGTRVAAVLLTHGHPDHAEGAPAFAAAAGGVGVRALDVRHRLGDEGLSEGDVIELDGLVLRVLATPGHSADSLSFVLPDSSGGSGPSGGGAVLTGDTILGRGTTVVAHPDGRLADYLASLHRLQALGPVPVLPGHGDALPDAAAVATAYLEHRQARLEQVQDALARGARTAEQVVEQVYVDVAQELWPAATLSVRAQLDYLSSRPDAP